MTTEEEANLKIQIDANTQTLDSLTQKFEKLTTVIDDAGKKLYILLDESKKLGEVKNPSFISTTPAGSFSAAKNLSPEMESLVRREILANSRYIAASASKERNEGIASVTRADAQKLKAMASQPFAEGYNRNSLTNAALLEDNKAYLQAKAELARTRNEILKQGESSAYNQSFEGSVASALFGQGQRFTYRGGLTGLMARFGSKMATDQSSAFGSVFGKLSDTSSKGNINNWFGGLLSKGTKDALGINAGGLAFGGVAIAAVAAAAGLKKLTDASLDTYGSMQKLSVGLEVVYGSKTESNQAFQEIQNYAIKSPYGVSQTTEMSVLLKQSGVYSSELLDTLKMVGDVSSGNEEKMKRIANNYAQIQAIGHASMLDMRQFAYAGIPIYKEVADYMKVSQTELRSMISDGKVTSDVIENVFKNMTSKGGMFYGAVNKGAVTYSARKQNLEDVKSIALSNIGEDIYNMGSSQLEGNGLGSSFMSLKENIFKGISDEFKGKNIEKDYKSALSATSINENIQKILDNTVSINGKMPKDGNWTSNNYVRNLLSGTNSDAIRAAMLNKFNKETKFSEKNLITEKDKKEIIQALRDYEKSIYTGKGSSEVDDITSRVENRKINSLYFSAAKFWGSILINQYMNSIPGIITRKIKGEEAFFNPMDSFKSFFNRDKSEENLASALKDTYTATERYSKIMEYLASLDNNKIAMARAAMISDISSFNQKNFDEFDKYEKNENSISSRTFKYNQLYANTEKGKLEQEQKDEKNLGQYKSDYKKYASMFNTDGTLKYEKFSKDDLIDAIKSGILQSRSYISLNPENVQVNSYDDYETRKEKLENMNYLSKNATNMLKGLNNGSLLNEAAYKFPDIYGSFYKNNITPEFYRDLQSFMKNIKVSSASELTGGRANSISTSFFNLMNSAEKSGMGELVSSMLINGDLSGISKYNGPDASGSGKSKLLAPLWKRIFAASTGWNADQMNGMTGATAMMGYIPFQNRAISQGMISGMVGSGLSSQQIANSLKYTNGINGESAQQIDWNATAKSFLNMANSADTTSTELSNLYDAVKGQADVYDKLKASMFTTGEEWTNIKDMNLSDAQKKQLENAYAGNTYTAEYKSGSKKGTTEEVVMQNGEWVVKSTGELVSSIKGLSLKTESILNPLDALSINMKNLEETLNISNSLSQKANELSKSTSSLQLETAFLRFGLGKFGLQNENNEAISKTLVDTFSPFLDIANKSKDERAKTIAEYKKNNKGKEGYVEISDSVITSLESLSGLKEDDLVDALAKLLDTDTFKPLREKYFTEQEKNTKAQKENENAKFDSGFMSKYGNYMGGNGFFNALSSGAYLKNGNSISDQMMSNMIGLSDRSFSDFAYGNVKDAFKSNNGHVIGGIYDYVSKYFSSNPQLGEKNLNPLKDALNGFDFAATNSALKELGLDINDVYSGFMKMSISVADTAIQMQSLGSSIGDLFKTTSLSAWTSSFETFGSTLISGADASSSLQDNFQKIGQSLYSQMGTMMASAGLQLIIGSGGIDGGKIAAGIALIGAGGLSSMLSGMMNDSSSDDTTAKLKQIKEDMADLLKQARDDAVYYESTLRHQTAISANQSVSNGVYTKVDDAIIKPNGTIYTNPDDYLYASTDPKNFIGGGSTPNVTFSIVNNGEPVAVESRKQTNTEDGLDIQLVIKNVVADGIAKGEFDDALAASNANQRGWSSSR